MQVWKSLPEWRERRRQIDRQPVGFVPTMGALHRGHASLVKRSVEENRVTVASIFVNPTQFNDPNDLAKYPATLDSDLALLESLGAGDVLVPSAAQLYPGGYRFRIEESHLSKVMEGSSRPGFFQGVMTVVLKLFQLVRPDRAYFGEKDYQQLQMISDMVKEFFLPMEIVPSPTIRADSGLAESSRNARLSADGKKKAALIFQALTTAKDCAAARASLESAGFQVDYVEEHFGRRFAAASLEGVRLIDNVPAARA